MAPKKKTTADIDAKKAKDIVNRATQFVNDAAKPLRVPMDIDIGTEWGQATEAVDALDEAFNADEEETFAHVLRSKFSSDDVEVRVMQVGPNGRLTDVSDKVNAKDLRPEDISGVKIEDKKTVHSLGRNPQSRETAFRLLQELLPGLKTQLKSGFDPARGGATSKSIKEMELVLAESDKILDHWKK